VTLKRMSLVKFKGDKLKKIIVTGATRGLGLAITARLKSEGYHVIATGRIMTDELSQLISSAEESGEVSFYSYDFRKLNSIRNFVKMIHKEHGVPYGLVNNAALGHDGVLGTMHDSQIIEMMNVNLAAPVLLTKYVSRLMLLQGEGRIINVSSIIGTTGFNGLSVYGATKAGISGFTKSLSRELGKAGITVNTLAPGYMETGMTKGLDDSKLGSIKRRSPMGRLAKVEDVAGSVVFLLGKDGLVITGTTITVDAGSTA
jgi:3-oxoacyl-[acyl-carrier protein] reductase